MISTFLSIIKHIFHFIPSQFPCLQPKTNKYIGLFCCLLPSTTLPIQLNTLNLVRQEAKNPIVNKTGI